jgi:hypothetical protein
VQHKFWVVQNLKNDMLLGCDFFSKYGAVIDFGNGGVTFRNSSCAKLDNGSVAYSKVAELNALFGKLHHGIKSKKDISIDLSSTGAISLNVMNCLC